MPKMNSLWGKEMVVYLSYILQVLQMCTGIVDQWSKQRVVPIEIYCPYYWQVSFVLLLLTQLSMLYIQRVCHQTVVFVLVEAEAEVGTHSADKMPMGSA